ncbi:hypothetical protein BDN67DRAFT_985401 [Paxillus ammoniavirescens]|nr:hypothetical protein BDN67DRAFT_985401 [Paxillus ammoniavirescens]
MPLEGEITGQRLSGHVNEVGTHLGIPQDKFEGNNDNMVTLGEANDNEATGNKEGQKDEGEPNKGDERTVVTDVNTNDTVHNPGSKMKAPPSIWLKGERDNKLSLYVEADHIETNGNHNDQKLPKDPVGTQDGDTHRPNEPTEPPHEEEGDKGEMPAQAYTVCTTLNGRVDDHPGQPDAMEMVQSYWRSVPESPDPSMMGTEAHTSILTLSTPSSITHTPNYHIR